MAAANHKTCFVIMPFGEKADLAGKAVKFDDIYEHFIKGAIEEADLEPIRCDKVLEAGFIHRRMLEYILSAPVAVADISLLNPNVFYELGIRHTLHEFVTVLIRRKDTYVPFNIANLNVIEYDETDLASVAQAKVKIIEFIKNGLRTRANDSLVHDVLDIRINTPPKRLTRRDVYEYKVRKAKNKSICIITGDIQKVENIDVWVNSENTNMQMARFYDWSISSVIRYLGAKRDDIGHVTEDTIANELGRIMQNTQSVPAGTVIATVPGELERSNNVKQIFHAAAVTGEIGIGYQPISNLSVCVTNSLKLIDSNKFRDRAFKSILFPLMGAGIAPDDLQQKFHSLFEAALSYLKENASSTIEKVYFIAWTEDELETCQSVLGKFAELKAPTGPS